jgi:hypothetical protein
MIKTCNHLYDEGGQCNSAAVTGQNYCTYHLRYRARQLRMAQLRARSERFDLKLPLLESMYAVQSALTQLAEALAADMIDPKHAQQLLSVLRLASLNLRHSDKWQPSVYHTEVAGPAVDLAAEYGLPPRPRPRHPSRSRVSPARSTECHPERRRRVFCAAGVEGPLPLGESSRGGTFPRPLPNAHCRLL